MKKFVWPLVWRKEAEKKYESSRAIQKSYQRDLSDAQNEWRTKWKPVLEKMVKMTAERRDIRGDFVLHVNLDRQYIEQVAMYNDNTIWRYISEMIGHQVEVQLCQMNFVGLHKMADEMDRRRYSSGIGTSP